MLCAGGFLVSYIGLTAIFSRLFEESNEEILVDGTTTTVNQHRALIFFVVYGAYTQYFLDKQDQYIHSLKNTETR